MYMIHFTYCFTSFSNWDLSIFSIVAAILDVRRPMTSEGSSISIIELPDSENMGAATGMLMLPSLQTELYTSG